ncbi:hypothetical protein [Lysobacter sp. TAB13]|uniref:hypothetical protein n=1 Tax=Lysobacter sp. TAB13 TaxID=3233065 RepID=UPI003F97DE02
MRAVIVSIAVAAALSACGGLEYRDTNAAVDARPECASGPSRPGESPPGWCERKVEAVRGDDKGEPVDFKKKKDDGGR